MKTVILCGNGITRNGWGPVIKGIGSVSDTFRDNPIDPNIYFANLIYRLRFLNHFKDEIDDAEKADKIKIEFARTLQTYTDLKFAISGALSTAQVNGDISLRSFIINIINTYKDKLVGIITLNWDTLLGIHLSRLKFSQQEIETLYLHGNIQNSRSMLLPSEVTEEPYRDSGLQGSLNGSAMHLLEKAERLIITGTSLNVLDVELHFILTDGFWGTDNPQEIIVIDRNPDPIYNLLCFYFPHLTKKMRTMQIQEE